MWKKYKNKVERLLAIVIAIKNNKGLKRKDLARLCGGVREETISEYIGILKKLGYPIVFNFAENGYELYRQDYTDLNNNFTEEEVLILLLALNSVRSLSIQEVHNLKYKLLDLLSKKRKNQIEKIIGEITDNENFTNKGRLISLSKIQEAIIKERKIIFSYNSAQAKTAQKQKVVPYAITWQRDKCYLIAKGNNEWPINYRLDRIVEIKITEEMAKIPEEFNLEKYIAQTWKMFSGPPGKIKLKFNSKLKTLVKDKFHSNYYNIIEEDKSEFTLTATIRGLEGLKIWLLSLGKDVEVIKPKKLREKMLATATEIKNIYEK